MRIPKSALNTTHDATNERWRVRDLGSVIEDKMSGMAGRRKRGSWWGTRERRAVPVIAERRGSFGMARRGGRSKKMAGPRSRGRETRKCV